MNQKLKIIFNQAWPLCILVAASVLFVMINTQSVGLDAHDESFYIGQAVSNYYVATWGALYAGFIRISALLTNSSLATYDLNQMLVNGVLWPSSLFLLMRKCQINRLTSFLCSLIFVISRGNLASTPHIHIFNLSCLFLNFSLIYNSNNRYRFLLFYFFLGTSLFIRQDNFIFSITFLVLSQALSFFEKKKSFLMLAGIPLSFLTGYFLIYSLVGTPYGKRAIEAFRDHYIWRNQDIATTALEFDQKFPKAKSILSFASEYPMYFIHHAAKNLGDLPIETMRTAVTKKWPPSNASINFILPGLIFLFFYLHILFDPGKSQISKIGLVFCFSILAQGLMSATLLQPWVKYLPGVAFVVFGILLPLFISQFLKRESHQSRRASYVFASLVSLLVCFATFRHDPSFQTSVPARIIAEDLDASDYFKPHERVLGMNWITFYGMKGSNLRERRFDIFGYIHYRESYSSFRDFLKRNEVDVFCYFPELITAGASLDAQLSEEIISVINDSVLNKQNFKVGSLNDSLNCMRFLDRWN
ncbi:MAG: hypothetical protein K2P81_05905 [Bacteriovoracaceae bacterium]|nr:hypothetical protein [Bacteriovoracaceae bacterium]